MNAENKTSRILIVDDTIKNIQVLGTVLKQEGYQINVAQNGRQAIDIASKIKPDLILLDVMMPEMDGFEACGHLKANAETAGIPIIFLTAKIETEDIVKGFDLGAVDYVTKPFNPTELLKRVDTHLSLYNLRRKLEDLVAERTAHLQHRVRELDARDRLMHLQMSPTHLTDVYQTVLQIVEDVLKTGKAIIYRPDEAQENLTARAAIGWTEPHVIQIEPDLHDVPIIFCRGNAIIAQVFRDQKPIIGNDGDAATPIMYEEMVLGVLWVDTLQNAELDVEPEMETLWRLGLESSLAIRAAQIQEELESGEIDVSALLNLDIEK
jgi:DNA-binding response OmpR family regulator